MMPPPGKSLFLWGRSKYPGRDPLAYAEALGMDCIIIPQPLYNSAFVREAVETFRRVYIYDQPTAWRPGVWRETWFACRRLAETAGADGVIADPEHAKEWDGRTTEADQLSQALADGEKAGLHVGVTTFPFHPLWKRWATGTWAHGASGVFGVMQMYSHRGFPREEQLPTLREWQETWPGGAMAALAAAWRDEDGSYMRSADEYRDYLRTFEGEPAAAFWHNPYPPEIGDEHADIIRAFISGDEPGRPEDRGRGRRVAGWLGLLALAASGALAFWWSSGQ